MKVTRKTREELAKSDLPKGIQICRCVGAYQDRSQAGSEMIVMTHEIISKEGEVLGRIIDRVTDRLAGGRKIFNICESFGLISQYEKEELKATDVIGRTARCEIALDRSSRKYGAMSKIVRYLPEEA